MNLNERYELMYKMYHQEDIDSLLNDMATNFVTSLANEVAQINTKYEEGGPLDTKENATNTIFAVTDEIADRMKAEVRFRVEQVRRLEANMDAVQKQLDEKEKLK